MACASGGKGDAASVSEHFPVGLRVLVVDDDVTCLRILEQMLRRCMYQVTTCSQAAVALNLLRQRKGCFDLVLSDVHMPDMDGFKLLELVGLEMDLPVIMMSADGRTHLVMRGIRHGACDYLIKPIRDEELKNIWQHVIRKRWNEIKENDNSGSVADHDHQKLAIDDEYTSSTSQGADEVLKAQKKRRDSKDEDDTELENDDLTTAKKPRVVWSVELHQQFVSAVNQLGIDKAVPKRILELMNVPGLTRENVASHLQKFRLYLKRLSGVAQQQVGLPTPYCGSVEQNLKLASLGRFDLQALATSGQLPPQTLAALHAELLSQPAGNLLLPALDQRTLLQASLQGSKCIPIDRNVTYSQPLINSSSNTAKQTSQSTMSSNEVLSEYAAWSSKSTTGEMVPSIVETNNNMLISFVQQQKHSMVPEQNRLINVQPSCLVVPTQSSPNFHAVGSPGSVTQSCSSFRNSPLDFNNPPSLDIEYKPCSVSPSSRSVQDNSCQQVPSSPMAMPTNSVAGTSRTSLVHHSKGTSIPTRFAVNEHEFSMSNMSQVKVYSENNGNKVKQEPAENVNVGIPVRRHLTPNDPMSVFSI